MTESTPSEELSDNEKIALIDLLKPGAELHFNIKGMTQVVHKTGPYRFIEMGREIVEHLATLNLIEPVRSYKEANVLEGEKWQLTKQGKKLAHKQHKSN
ncbi:MAG: hypothetical protein ACI9S8_001559 [Chlamydiales bacterium]|jgi:hypothetical protein